MFTGICKLDIVLYESESLKDKRRILKSITERLKNKYNISVSEVGNNDKWQTASIGVSTVSNSRLHADRVLDAVIRFVETDVRVEITKCYRETI
ncbi:MAG: DUF503 domain-containing protein [Bacillota bacterium]|nr:DUF503 domain-containing protein [Bacillota bacterium]MDD3299133.1 DUF503 domain-containing protein [Bacillota bacterium]MDD3851527.1 DUF503 domain-containing protein [Bacillota bacterium]MDD4708263.1 DUF503 domain-containing protein [Bacillota bacterium]